MTDLPFADARVHSELLATGLRKRFNLDSVMNFGIRYSVSVEGGVSSGLSAEMYGRDCKIGSSFESDIVLLDDGIAENHISVVMKSSFLGPVANVITEQDDVLLNGTPLMPNKASGFTALPLSLELNGKSITIDHNSEQTEEPSPLTFALVKYGKITFLVFALLILASFSFNRDSFSLNIGYASNEPEYQLIERQVKYVEKVELAAADAQNKLATLGLSEEIGITTNGVAGTLELNGTLKHENIEAWTDFQHWYDQQQNPVMLTKVSMAPRLEDFPPIASIKLSEPRKLILVNGDQISPGGQIFDHLHLVSIEETQLVLSLRGEKIEMSFSQEGS